MNRLTGNPTHRAEHSARLYDLLLVNDFDRLKTLFEAFFASIPYQWHTNNEIAHYEGYYASVFLLVFRVVGAVDYGGGQQPSGSLGHGGGSSTGTRTCSSSRWWNGAATGAALGQLQARDYAAKYRGRGEAIYLVGVEFSRETTPRGGFCGGTGVRRATPRASRRR